MTSLPFRPLVQEWFARTFGAPTAPQREGWPAITRREDTLIAAPTGSGKTLAAFLSCIDALIGESEAETLGPGVRVLYVSPLKALSNDIAKNLLRPLAELEADAGRAFGIDVLVRTGDTPARERAKMAKTPPHILVTTPESLYILLTSDSGRAALADVKTVIVDEIHTMAADKRGAHLALSLERLDHLVTSSGAPRPQRIGLSATQRPIALIGALLVGADRDEPTIVDAGFLRELDLAIEVPSDELGPVASNEMMAELYDRIAEQSKAHKTTIVFVHTRRLVERFAHALAERMGETLVAAHHGSLSKQTRLSAEQRLKSGELKVVVATASLELGIDVGEIELVVHVGAPRSIASFLQRVGRSGHCLGATPKGRLYPLTRDQLVESAATIRAVRAGVLDELSTPPAPLDVLAQQIVATCAAGTLDEDTLFAVVRRAHHYRDLLRETFDEVVAMLSDGIVSGKGHTRTYLFRDRINGTVTGRRNARLTAITSGGAIPDNGNYAVVADPDETFVGTLDEDFAVESSAGDIFLLGNTSWRIRRVESGRVRVEDAKGQPPNVPFWRGEAPARTRELSAEVSALREIVATKIGEEADEHEIAAWLSTECAMPLLGAEQLVDYFTVTRRMLGALPTTDTLVAERFFDEAGGMQLVIHAPLGARLNRAWGLALRKRFCKTFDFELQAAATDDGVLISLGPVHSFPLESVFEFLDPKTVEEVLVQAVLQSPLFGVRWRWVAQRALAVPRRRGGKKVPAPLMRMHTDDLLTGVFPMAVACQDNVTGPLEVPDHPLVFEALRDCLEEAMDVRGLEALLTGIRTGAVRVVAVDTPEPSPLGHELLNANPYAYLDDAPLEERRARAVVMRRGLTKELARELGELDPDAIHEVSEQARPDVRDHDELHDALLGWILWPEVDADPTWRPWYDQLVAQHRATTLVVGDRRFWIASERRGLARAAFDVPNDSAALQPPLPPLPFVAPVVTPTEARLAVVRAHIETSGPTTAEAIGERFGLSTTHASEALHTLEAEGAVLRGSFTNAADGIEWCDRQLLARIHRRTVSRLREAIEPVTPAAFLRFLFGWQHVTEHGRLRGLQGTLQIIAQLQGFQAPATAWETSLLPARIADFDPSWVDLLTLDGEVAWGRLSLRDGGDGKVVSRAARITFVLRDALPWILAETDHDEAAAAASLTSLARAIYEHLAERGASFSRDLAHKTGADGRSIADALRELVYTGLVTADGFGALRGLLDAPARPAVAFMPRFGLPRTGRSSPTVGGRWTRLRHDVEPVVDRFSYATQLLHRYGVVFRDLLVREPHPPPWRELLVVLRRLEARSEVRGGRFVSGFVGEQFALPEAVDALRAARRADTEQVVRIAATDPLNLVGILTPGPRVPATPGNEILFCNGVPVASREGGRVVERSDRAVDAQLQLLPRARVQT